MSTLRLSCLILSLSSFLLLPAAAGAANVRVAMLPFVGPGAADVEGIIVASLPSGHRLVPLEQVDKAIARAGNRLPATAPAHAALARRLVASAVVEGRVSNQGIDDRAWRLLLTVRRGSTGLAVGAVEFKGADRRELLTSVRKLAVPWLKTLLGKVTVTMAPTPATSLAPPLPPPAEPPAPLVDRSRSRSADDSNSGPRDDRPMARNDRDSRDGQQAPRQEGGGDRYNDNRQNRQDRNASSDRDDRDDRSGDDGDTRDDRDDDGDREVPPQLTASARKPMAQPLWELSVGPRMLSRVFVFTDNVAGLPGYTLPGAMALLGSAEFFPAARSRSPMQNFGVAGQVESSVGAKTVGRDGAKAHATRTQAYRFGGRYRWREPGFAVTLGGDYGEHRFSLDIPDAIAPNVTYTFVRPSLAGRIEVGSGVSLGLSAGYLHILSVGGLGDEKRFPRISARGAEVGAVAGYAFDSDFEMRLTADLRHYAHDMNVKPGDPLVVGGAVDEHFGAAMLLTYRVR